MFIHEHATHTEMWSGGGGEGGGGEGGGGRGEGGVNVIHVNNHVQTPEDVPGSKGSRDYA